MTIPRRLKPCKTCGDPKYLFSHGNCLDCCNRLKLTQKPTYNHVTLKQCAKQPARPFKIKPVSDKRAKLNSIYNVAAAQFKKDNVFCMAGLPGCTRLTTDVHHKRGRGEYLLDTRYFLPTCRTCHDWIELNVNKAKALGLSEDRL